MKKQYRYGDLDKISLDSAKLFDIESRQGSGLILECLAESVRRSAEKFNLSFEERNKIVSSLVKDLTKVLGEKLFSGGES